MDECRLANFGLAFEEEAPFVKSHWPIPHCLFVLYRLGAAGYTLGWLFYTCSGSTSETIPYIWPVYLTNWTYLMLTVHMLFGLVSVVIALYEQSVCSGKGESSSPNEASSLLGTRHLSKNDASACGSSEYTLTSSGDEKSGTCTEGTEIDFVSPAWMAPDAESIRWHQKFNWITYNIICSMAVIVTVIYFAMLYPQASHDGPPGLEDLQLHGINSVLVVIEILLAGFPVKFLHFIYPLFYGLSYIIFTLIFWSFDHARVIYPKVLDWNKPGNTTLLIVIVGFIVFPLLQALHLGAYKLKRVLYATEGNQVL